MSSTEQISFFAPKNFSNQVHSTLICGSALQHRSVEAERLGDQSILLLNHRAEDISIFAGKELIDILEIPSGGHELTHGHGPYCLALLDFAVEFDWDYLWYVHHDVYLAGNWAEFFESFEGSTADFIAPCLRNRQSDPNWYWWKFFKFPPESAMSDERFHLAALSTIFRISRRGFDRVRSAVMEGLRGHCEAILPTAVSEAGFTVEDIGGHGDYSPTSRQGLHYSNATFAPRNALIKHTPGFLHYPIPSPISAPSPQRFRPATKDIPKILYFSPIGPAAPGLLHDTVARFRQASAELFLVEYQSTGIEYPKECNLIRDKGQKWELVRRHLDPKSIEEFDYIFVWDDDIGIADFDVLRFVKIMESNRLDLAQPSLTSPHPLCHQITRQKSCPPPLGDLNRVGRLTNFVEIMVPVFTRNSWAEFYSYLTPASRFGWGMDSLLLGRMGIVDCMHVVHTRPCNRYGSGARDEMRNFLNSQGLFERRHQELGYLLEESRQS